ncbi:MAG: 3-phosphoshikimate 1-carboxyvinyltransferase [Planctomycetales bacterium 12-60-4]|nr:MAG: 3-phosphoshikimate 1-carboxyvinyltransferase [Planctomycetales bacterium 12-60-4]
MEVLEVRPVSQPVSGVVRPPGSKSLTNRALVIAAMAEGESELQGVLDSRDTQVMVESLRRLGLSIEQDRDRRVLRVQGCAGQLPVAAADLYLDNSGTSIRFLTAMCTLGAGRYRLDGNERMRQRPISDLLAALNQLGAQTRCELGTDSPPVIVEAQGLQGGTATVETRLSSQYLSAVLMAAPGARQDVEIRLTGTPVSEPYIDMTLGVMARFGVVVDTSRPQTYRIRPDRYRGCTYQVEPDASAASYFFAAAAITGGAVTVEGLSQFALQGDVHFVEALEQMGCGVHWGSTSITVHGAPLKGIDIDMNAISDTAQTLAAVAVFADGPTTIRNVSHMRVKETDRVSAVVQELRRLGIQTDEHPDGLTIHPGQPQPADIETYDDHRMAMSFALVGLRAPGVRIQNPGCTAKTYPEFFDDLERLCAPARG